MDPNEAKLLQPRTTAQKLRFFEDAHAEEQANGSAASGNGKHPKTFQKLKNGYYSKL